MRDDGKGFPAAVAQKNAQPLDENLRSTFGLATIRHQISQVRVAAPYTPIHSMERTDNEPADVPQQDEPGGLLMLWEIIPLVVIAGLALIIYLIRRALHNKFN